MSVWLKVGKAYLFKLAFKTSLGMANVHSISSGSSSQLLVIFLPLCKAIGVITFDLQKRHSPLA